MPFDTSMYARSGDPNKPYLDLTKLIEFSNPMNNMMQLQNFKESITRNRIHEMQMEEAAKKQKTYENMIQGFAPIQLTQPMAPSQPEAQFQMPNRITSPMMQVPQLQTPVSLSDLNTYTQPSQLPSEPGQYDVMQAFNLPYSNQPQLDISIPNQYDFRQESQLEQPSLIQPRQPQLPTINLPSEQVTPKQEELYKYKKQQYENELSSQKSLKSKADSAFNYLKWAFDTGKEDIISGAINEIKSDSELSKMFPNLPQISTEISESTIIMPSHGPEREKLKKDARGNLTLIKSIDEATTGQDWTFKYGKSGRIQTGKPIRDTGEIGERARVIIAENPGITYDQALVRSRKERDEEEVLKRKELIEAVQSGRPVQAYDPVTNTEYSITADQIKDLQKDNPDVIVGLSANKAKLTKQKQVLFTDIRGSINNIQKTLNKIGNLSNNLKIVLKIEDEEAIALQSRGQTDVKGSVFDYVKRQSTYNLLSEDEKQVAVDFAIAREAQMSLRGLVSPGGQGNQMQMVAGWQLLPGQVGDINTARMQIKSLNGLLDRLKPSIPLFKFQGKDFESSIESTNDKNTISVDGLGKGKYY